MIQSTIVYKINLFTMPGMLLNAMCCLCEIIESLCCNQLFTVYCHEWNKTLDEELSTSLKRFWIPLIPPVNVAIE